MGGHARHSRCPCFEQHQRLRFADAGQNDHVDASQVLLQLHTAAELEGFAEVEVLHHRLALGEVHRILVGRTQQLHENSGHPVAQQSGGADAGLDVLDRHHTTDQRHGGATRRGVAGNARQRVTVDAVRNHDEPVGGRSVAQLQLLVAGVQRGDATAALVAALRVADECLDPDIAKVATALVEVERGGQLVGQPVGHRDLDTTLVGVDAVFSQQPRTPCFENGSRQRQAGVAGRDGVIDARSRQRCQQHREQPAGQRAPAPEVVEEGTSRNRRFVHALQHRERRFGQNVFS